MKIYVIFEVMMCFLCIMDNFGIFKFEIVVRTQPFNIYQKTKQRKTNMWLIFDMQYKHSEYNGGIFRLIRIHSFS